MKRKSAPPGLIRCGGCSKEFMQPIAGVMYCGNACKQRAWVAKNGPKKRPAKTVCAYYAALCVDCGCGIGGKGKRQRCEPCKAKKESQKACDWARITREAIHRAAAREAACGECSAVFCPVYGYSSARFCQPCSDLRTRRAKRASRLFRKALARGVGGERVDPIAVFERDKWRCQLCGVKTPKAKRGTYAVDAPELDHILPVSKGGAHTYLNTQCACRKCNGAKSDKPMGQMLLIG